MTAWIIAGMLATACGFLLWERIAIARLMRELKAELTSQYEAKLEYLRREKDLLLHTALDAKGIQVIDPSQAPSVRNAEVIGRRTVRERVKEGLDRLAEADRKAAAKREADRAEQLEELRQRAKALDPTDAGVAPS